MTENLVCIIMLNKYMKMFSYKSDIYCYNTMYNCSIKTVNFCQATCKVLRSLVLPQFHIVVGKSHANKEVIKF